MAVTHPHETVLPFLRGVRDGLEVWVATVDDTEEGAPDLRMKWRPRPARHPGG